MWWELAFGFIMGLLAGLGLSVFLDDWVTARHEREEDDARPRD